MRKLLSMLSFILGLTCVFVFTGLLFYLSTNNYYIIFHKITDLSLYGWGMMLVIWTSAFILYGKKRYEMLFFAAWFSVICFVFDCYRFVIYQISENSIYYLRAVLEVEIVYLILTGCKRLKLAFMYGVSALVITLIGQWLVYPSFLPLRHILLLAFFGAMVWFLYNCIQKYRGVVVKSVFVLNVMALLGSIFYAIWIVYDRQSGIRFYEKPVTEVSKNIKVSVIVPVYNAEKKVEKALDSLRHQTLKDIEIICVNDGSTDKSGEILDKYAKHDKRIKVIHQKNAFVGAARNRGIQEAKGEYIGFLDNDDWVSPNYYEELYKAAKKHNLDVASTAVVYVVTREYPEEKKKKEQRVEFENKEIIDDLAYYEDKAWGYVWDKIYKKSFLKKHNIRFSLYRTGYEDNYFSTQVYMWAHKMVNVKGIAYYYFRGDVSYSVGQNHKPTDEAPEMYVDLDKLINSADVSDVEKERWLGAAQNIRHFSFTDYYRVLSPEDKKIWKDRIREAFPEDNIDFDRLEKDIEAKTDDSLLTYL